MLVVKCQEHFDVTKKYAQAIGREKEFTEALNRLNKMGDTIELYKDFAPYSFTFIAFENGKRYLEGGLIYHGFDSATTLSITVTPTTGWSIHT